MDEPLRVRIDCVAVDCADPEGLADFWCALLGYERQATIGRQRRIACTWICDQRTTEPLSSAPFRSVPGGCPGPSRSREQT